MYIADNINVEKQKANNNITNRRLKSDLVELSGSKIW